MNNELLPDGFSEIKIEGVCVYSNGKQLVITGEPPADDNEAEVHDCDAMGCNWEHVLMVFDIDESNKKYINHVMKNPLPAFPESEG